MVTVAAFLLALPLAAQTLVVPVSFPVAPTLVAPMIDGEPSALLPGLDAVVSVSLVPAVAPLSLSPFAHSVLSARAGVPEASSARPAADGRLAVPHAARPAAQALRETSTGSRRAEPASVWRRVFDGVVAPQGPEAVDAGLASTPRDRDIPFNGAALPPRAFSDKTRISVHLIDAIDHSAVSIDIAIHGLSIKTVADALLRAKDRGVRVRIVMNETHVYPQKRSQKRSPEIQFLIDNGFDMRTLRGTGPYGVMHNKFAVFDGKVLEAGSFNWSQPADTAHFENAVFLDDPHRIAGFQSYWDWMWARSKPLREGSAAAAEGAVAPADAPPTDADRPVQFKGDGFPAYSFSPNGGTEAWLVKAVTLARESIDIAMFSFTSHELQDALLEAKRRGARVRLAFDKDQASNLKEMQWFARQGFEVRLSRGKDGKDGVLHNKFAVFDGALLETGSFNWTGNAEGHNYENAEFFDSAADIAGYQSYYERIWAQAKAPTSQDLREPPEQLPEDFEIH